MVFDFLSSIRFKNSKVFIFLFTISLKTFSDLDVKNSRVSGRPISLRSDLTCTVQSFGEGWSHWTLKNLYSISSFFMFARWCKKLILLALIMFLILTQPDSRYRLTIGVDFGTSKIFLNSCMSNFSNWLICSWVTPYHDSELNRIPFRKILSLNKNAVLK